MCSTTAITIASIMFAGQSNVQRIQDDRYLNGVPYSVSEYSQLIEGSNDVANTSFATWSGSAADQANASASTPDNYWAYRDEFGAWQDGERLDDAIAVLKDPSTVPPEFIVWMQGEQDATRIDSIARKMKFKAATSYILQRLMENCGRPDCQVVLSSVGRRITEGKEYGSHLARMAHLEIASENARISLASDNYDLNLEDSIHYSSIGQVEYIKRISESICAIKEGSTKTSGVKVLKAQLNVANKKHVRLFLEDNTQTITAGGLSVWLFSARNFDGTLGNGSESQAVEVVDSETIDVCLNTGVTSTRDFFIGYGLLNDHPLTGGDISDSADYNVNNEFGNPIQPAMLNLIPRTMSYDTQFCPE